MQETFSILDWSIVALTLAAMLVIGYRSSRQNKTQEDFLVGGKKQKSGIVGLSLFASLFSALGYLSSPGEAIMHGPLYLSSILACPAAGWIVSKFLIPRYRKYNVASGYQILEMELGEKSRLLSSCFFIMLRFMWMSTIMYAMVDKALLPLLGLDEKWFLPTALTLILITVAYTTMGGIRAVLKTDALQSIIMFGGAILTIIVILCALPDKSILFNAGTYGHWTPVEWKPDLYSRMTVANLFFMELCWQVATAGSDQMAIQRYFTVKNAKEASRSFYISLAASSSIRILLSIVGVLVMAYYFTFPGSFPQGVSPIENADSLYPCFIMNGLPTGVTGLMIAAILAAAMSSLSSGLISVSTVIQEDLLRPTKSFKDKKFTIKDIRLISIIIGILISLSCVMIGNIPGNLYDISMKVVNLVVEPLFVLFVTALFIPWKTDFGAVTGGLVSLAVAILISFVGLGGITELWIMPISLVTGIVAAMIASLFKIKRT